MTIGIDTNVLVRYLTKDDEKQWIAAVKIIESGEVCFLTNIVLCKLFWVLRGKAYKYQKEAILKVIFAMLRSPTFEFEDRSTVYQAVTRAKNGQADFADYLIGAIALNRNCREVVSFDRKLERAIGFRILDI